MIKTLFLLQIFKSKCMLVDLRPEPHMQTFEHLKMETFEQKQVSATMNVSHDDFYRDKLMIFLTLSQG